MSNILVTGGAGFIGSNVVDKFLAENHTVAVIDNLVTGDLNNLPKNFPVNLIFKQCSILSREAKEFILNFFPDIIIHLAAQINVRNSVTDPIFDAEQNILGTINLLEIARQVKATRFIFSSTGGAIYGEQDYFPADENHPVNPECPYGLSKNCAELYLKYFSSVIAKEHPDFKSIALRFGNVYGPRQNPKGEAGVVAIFSKRALAGEKLVINGDGEQTRDFVYVGDIVEAIYKSSTAKIDLFGVYNLGTGIETNINEIATLVREISVNKFSREPVEIIHGPAASGEQVRSLLDPSKFSQKFSWSPKVDLNKGLTLTLESFAFDSTSFAELRRVA